MFGVFSSIDSVTDYLFISGYAPVTKEKLTKLGITLIVDATNVPNRPLDGIDTIKIAVDDCESALLKPFFDDICDKIKENKEKNGKTLVHCAAGISRSATLCIVYFIKHENLTLKQAYSKVYEKRSIISPNNGFWRQMIEYEKELRGLSSVEMVKTKYREVPDLYLRSTLCRNVLVTSDLN